MKKNILLLLIFISSHICVASTAFIQPSEARILEKSFQLQKEEKKNLHIKYGVRTVLGGLLAYSLYNGFVAPKEVKFEGTAKAQLADLRAEVAQLKEKIGARQGFMGWLEDKIVNNLPSLAAQIAFIMAVTYTMEKMQHKPHSIHSYMGVNTRLQANMSALVEHCKELEKGGTHSSQKLVTMAYNNVLEDVENIIGFIECRARAMDDEQAQRAYYFARTMFKATEKLCRELQEQLAGDMQLTKAVAQFHQTVMSLIATYYASFHHLELAA